MKKILIIFFLFGCIMTTSTMTNQEKSEITTLVAATSARDCVSYTQPRWHNDRRLGRWVTFTNKCDRRVEITFYINRDGRPLRRTETVLGNSTTGRVDAGNREDDIRIVNVVFY
jgi:hypothetical protein